jgi:DUF1009 family protein
MVEVGATVLAVEAFRTILLDRERVIEAADQSGVAVVAFDPEEPL